MGKNIEDRDRKVGRRDKMKTGGSRDHVRLSQHRSGQSPREQAMREANREADSEVPEN